jgi:hypothetical protein
VDLKFIFSNPSILKMKKLRPGQVTYTAFITRKDEWQGLSTVISAASVTLPV